MIQRTYFMEDIPKVAKEIILYAKYRVFLFYGEMGLGKTTLIKELIKQLGVNEIVNSPTFSLVKEYLSHKNGIIYHFDFCRIKDEEEAYDVGIEEYFEKDAWCFVEWPSIVENLLPPKNVKLYLTKNKENYRNLRLVQSI